jgi:hypothetical protein
MKEDKLLKYLFSSKTMHNQTINDRQKYDTRLLAFLSSDKVILLLRKNEKKTLEFRLA